MMIRTKIVLIMSDPPAYLEYSNQPKPRINFDTENGSWVGIWGTDWSDLIALQVLDITDDYVFEVWQPDLRADKIYSHEIKRGLVHILFPAVNNKKIVGLKSIDNFRSDLMCYTLIKECRNQRIILHVSQPIHIGITKDILEVAEKMKCPVLMSIHGEISIPIIDFWKFQKNILAKFNKYLDHLVFKRLIKRISILTYQSQKNLKVLNSYYKNDLQNVTMGCDFDIFKKLDKIKCREELGLPKEIKIMVTVSRLYPLKQIDRVIEILSDLSINHDFLYIVLGHGNNKYEEYLKKKASSLLNQNKIIFSGFKKKEDLVKYINCADLFIHTSKSEAGPVANMEAMACEVPIFTTRVGHTSETLIANGCGALAETNDYISWKYIIENFLKGNSISVLDRKIAQQNYDQKLVGNKFEAIYKKMSQKIEK